MRGRRAARTWGRGVGSPPATPQHRCGASTTPRPVRRAAEFSGRARQLRSDGREGRSAGVELFARVLSLLTNGRRTQRPARSGVGRRWFAWPPAGVLFRAAAVDVRRDLEARRAVHRRDEHRHEVTPAHGLLAHRVDPGVLLARNHRRPVLPSVCRLLSSKSLRVPGVAP